MNNKLSIQFLLFMAAFATIMTSCSTIPGSTVSSKPTLTSSPGLKEATPGLTPTVEPSSSYVLYENAPATISTQSDGDVLHVNLVKFVGKVSSLDSRVFVNNTPATVTSDGSYYAFLDLAKGKNVIQVNTVNGTRLTNQSLSVTFVPPVAVRIDYPKYDKDVDYSKTPLTITGAVDDPTADVTIVEGTDYFLSIARVASDGSFSSAVLLREIPNAQGFGITAKARLGNEIAQDTFYITYNKGRIGPSPSPWNGSSFDISPKDQIIVKAGLTSTVDYTMNIRNDYFTPSVRKIAVVQLKDGTYSDNQDKNGNFIGRPMTPGLSAEVEPSDFTTYCNIRYDCTIKITADTNLPPGAYYFGIQNEPGGAGGLFTIDVER